MASPILSSPLSFVPSPFASVPFRPYSSTSSSSAAGPLSTSNSAAAPIQARRITAAAAAFTRSATRRTDCGVVVDGRCVLGEGLRRYTSKFNGPPVPVTRVSPARTARRGATSRRSPGVASSALVQKVTANELDSILSAERTSPMIIDFYATWCGPCVVLAQELEQLAVEYGGDVRFLKVDTDEEHELASQMEIRGLPTMVFVSKDVDKLAIRTEGLLPTNAIRDIIEKEILV